MVLKQKFFEYYWNKKYGCWPKNNDSKILDLIHHRLFKRSKLDLNLQFIHVGKCGGSFISVIFKTNFFFLKETHLKKPSYHPEEKYLIWVRNPLNRFVSAFNMALSSVNFDCSKIKDLKEINFNNCSDPYRVRKRYMNQSKYTYSEEFDELIKYFKTPNDLAEDLFTDEKAMKLMNIYVPSFQHLLKGVGWYLDNGEFVKKHHSSIYFVGRQENMNEDLQKFSKKINVKLYTSKKKLRECKDKNCSKYLSKKAIRNLIEFYKDTDYKALEELNKYDFLDDDTLASYYKYNN